MKSVAWKKANKTKLIKVADILDQASALFQKSPEIRESLVISYLDGLQRLKATPNEFDEVMAGLAFQEKYFPCFKEVMEAVLRFKEIQNTEVIEYITVTDLNLCKDIPEQNAIELIFAGLILLSIRKKDFNQYASKMRSILAPKPAVYEIAYCYLYYRYPELLKGLELPVKTMPKLWKIVDLEGK